MNTDDLKIQLQQPYRRETWQSLLPQLLPGVELFRQPVDTPLTNEAQRAIATGLRQIGRAVIRDEQAGERVVAVFEADIAPKVKMLRNRVALRQLVARCIDEVSAHAVLAFFVQSGIRSYRLTYAARESVLGPDLKVETRETATKRFTYVLGPGETCRTAAQRLAGLAQNRDKIQWKDIADAFSVEKLNDEFFKTYKQHYQAFCQHLIESDAPASVFHLKLRGLKDKERDKALKPVRDFIKRLLGRLVFLHFLQKKGWMGCPANRTDWTSGDPEFIQTWFAKRKSGGNFYRDFLVPLFYDALNNNDRPRSVFAPTGTRVPYLNGGLFERELVPESGHKPLEVEKLDLPDSLFAGLLDFFGQYNFTIDENDPDDHEIGIDPEMLGHVFENLLEDNKDKGAYYTPKAIVQYMCQQSLIHYLQGHFRPSGGTTSVSSADATERVPPTEAETAIERLIRLKEPIDPKADKNWLTLHAHRLEQLLDEVKICDPAIGSGAFPIGLLQEIYWTRLTLHPGMDRAKAKRDIIQKSIYGVDIDAGAVEIARLRCWLALIVEEEQPRPLPNLDFKIMQGDSLLESFEGIPLDKLHEPDVRKLTVIGEQHEFYLTGVPTQTHLATVDERREITELIAKYFDERDPVTKAQMHAAIDACVLAHIDRAIAYRRDAIEGLIDQQQNMIAGKLVRPSKNWSDSRARRRVVELQAEHKGLDGKQARLHQLRDIPERPYFLWHLFFQDAFARGGFDIVIANPPFVSSEQFARTGIQDAWKSAFPDTFTSRVDIYCFFYELGLKHLLRPGGHLCFISSNKYLRTGYGKGLRRLIAGSHCIHTLIDFGELPVFAASTDPAIILIQNTRPPNAWSFPAAVIKTKEELNTLAVSVESRKNVFRQENLSPEGWTLESPATLGLLAKLRRNGTALETVVQGRFYYGIKTGFNEAFVIDEAKRDELIREDPGSAELIKPWLQGREIKRWNGAPSGLYVITVRFGFHAMLDRYPAILKHLTAYRRQLAARGQCMTARGGGTEGQHHWLELDNNPTEGYLASFEKPKIVFNETSKELHAFVDYDHLYINKTGFILLPDDPEYVLAVLMSNTLDWLYRMEFPSWGDPWKGGRIQFRGDRMAKVPIPDADDATKDRLRTFARRATKAAGSELTEIEAEINQIVYQLFKLEPGEIALIESASSGHETASDHKSTLFTRILPELSATAPYFCMETVAKKMADLQLTAAEASLKSYMSEAMKKGIVHDAGRGWYSRLTTPVTLDTKPVKAVISRIEKAFPLLEFSCWSTEQVNPYMHHLLAKFVTFVYADRDLMPALFDAMQGWKGYRVYLDPKTADARCFRLEDNTIVIRPDLAQAPESHHHMAPAERTLVDLAVEAEALPILGSGEAQDMACCLVTTGRVAMNTLLRYAQRRRVEPVSIFGEKWSTNVTNQ